MCMDSMNYLTVAVADPEICPRGARCLTTLAARGGGHLFFDYFQQEQGGGASGALPGSATELVSFTCSIVKNYLFVHRVIMFSKQAMKYHAYYRVLPL